MEVLITANGALTLVLVPTNEMEVQMLKQLDSQDNEINFTSNGIQIVNKSVPQGLVISKISSEKPILDLTEDTETTASNESEAEDL